MNDPVAFTNREAATINYWLLEGHFGLMVKIAKEKDEQRLVHYVRQDRDIQAVMRRLGFGTDNMEADLQRAFNENSIHQR